MKPIQIITGPAGSGKSRFIHQVIAQKLNLLQPGEVYDSEKHHFEGYKHVFHDIRSTAQMNAFAEEHKVLFIDELANAPQPGKSKALGWLVDLAERDIPVMIGCREFPCSYFVDPYRKHFEVYIINYALINRLVLHQMPYKWLT
jgi:predicted AAA+ superfamily ATPase